VAAFDTPVIVWNIVPPVVLALVLEKNRTVYEDMFDTGVHDTEIVVAPGVNVPIVAVVGAAGTMVV